MSGPRPAVSVLIVSWNRCVDLRETLTALSRQEGVSFETIVVDNGSTDGTFEMLSDWPLPLRVIINPTNRGACVGKNQAILAARSEYIAFLDSDATLLNPRALADCVAHLREDPKLGVVGGPIYVDLEQTIPWVFGIHFTDDLYIDWEKTRNGFGECDALSTCFMVMPRQAALDAGGFDPVYFYQHEDLDFFLQLKRLGYRFEVLPGYPVWHRISQVGRKVDRWFWMHFREEWRHQYLLIKEKGFFRSLGYFVRNFYDSARLRAYYVRPIRFRKFVVLFGMLPVGMLMLSPLILSRRGKNYLRADLLVGPEIAEVGGRPIESTG